MDWSGFCGRCRLHFHRRNSWWVVGRVGPASRGRSRSLKFSRPCGHALPRSSFAYLAFFAVKILLPKHAVKHAAPTSPAAQLARIEQILFRMAQIKLHQHADAMRPAAAVANGI